jgi:Family of unknown function (DUF6498)
MPVADDLVYRRRVQQAKLGRNHVACLGQPVMPGTRPGLRCLLRGLLEGRREWSRRVRRKLNRIPSTLEMVTDNTQDNWLSSWPDALAFAVGLAVAWWGGWNAGDLVWSLWLSSFVVGYSTIVWMIGQPAVELARASWKDRALVDSNPRMLMIFWSVLLIGALFFLAFFTVHFGGFHYVQSQFLITFFPLDAADGARHATSAGMSTYVEVARRYWPFLPSAFLTHRSAFLRKPLSLDRDLSLTSFASGNKMSSLLTEPYRNVLRMHVLIFFFFFAHFAKLENFAVYAVVYAAYFFPWRLVRRPETPAPSVSLQPPVRGQQRTPMRNQSLPT